jgi:uncharacterized protein HemX
MTDSNPSHAAPNESASVEQGDPQSAGAQDPAAGAEHFPTAVPPGTTTANHPRRNRTMPVLVALVVVLFLAAGAFGTLWFIERGDHKATTDQLTASRADADDAKAKRQKSEAREREANDTLMRNAGEQEKVKDKVTQAWTALTWMAKGSAPCATAGRKFADVLMTGTSTESNNAMFDVGIACGT